MGYFKTISSVVEKHGWQIFIFHPDDALTKVKVLIQMNEDIIPSKGAITKQLALRFPGEEMLRHPGSTSTSPPPLNIDTAPSTSHSNFK
ncbi:hypothetical protein PVK06_007913 [Gossypium arboreum]|uniref:Uncharacterized protein n=1 Tax=Gossypium arboreum TaxID=29729 RepID=A0ABR0QJK8_GOSAR|nr:hypothetical protein PVK06_007913 [Gossypium arboreum]